MVDTSSMSDPIASFSGIVSGINFRDLVDQIVAVEARPATLLQQQISEIERRQTAWGDFDSRVQTLVDRAEELAAGTAFNTFLTGITGFSSTAGKPVSVTASSTAEPGSISMKVLQLAQREKLGSDIFDSKTDPLGLSGDFVVNGSVVTLSAADGLADVATKINQANTGSNASGVGASVVSHPSGGYRLVMTASRTGSAGIELRDAGGGVLSGLGFSSGSVSIANATSDGAMSDGFATSSTALSSLLGLATAPASGSVTIGGFGVTIDLSTDSLDDIASAINTAATGAGSAVTAEVITETVDGVSVKRLDISGTTSFSDTNGILESIGVLEASRDAVAHSIQGAAFTDGDASTPAAAGTLLTDLWNGGATEGVADGDTLTLTGTRGDGTTFSKTFAITTTTTYQDLVDALNDGTDGFGAGSRTATASIDGSGRLVVTDDAGGDSRLSLSIVANNQGGGSLDFGDFDTTAVGRNVQIAEGLDAQVEIDGTFVTRSKNVVSDVVAGVTINLEKVTEDTVTIDVSRDVDAAVSAVDRFVKAFNAVSEYVNSQFDGVGAEGDRLKRPLSGDSVLRQMRTDLRELLESRMSLGVTGSVTRLADLGIEIDRSGTYELDSEVLRSALVNDPEAVEHVFSVYGTGSSSAIEFVGSGDATQAGIYDVAITQAAAQATVTSSGFGGTYVDDGTADTLTITDAGTGSAYAVDLSNGMTLTEIVDALNLELGTARAHELQVANGMYSDGIGTVATDSTTLDSLFDAGGTNLGIADGDVFTISGTRHDGSAYLQTFTVTDVETQTLGDLRAVVTDQLGADVDVELVDGVLKVTAREEERSSLTLSVTSDNAGGGTFDLGTTTTLVEGRSASSILASESGGELALTHDAYGSAEGFDLAFTAGGTDGSATLGLAAGSYRGVDVAGTIGGLAATGAGRVLTGADGSAIEGLIVRYSGATTGAVGSTTFSRGIGSMVQLLADSFANDVDGSIKSIIDGMDDRVDSLNDRIDDIQARLDRRRELLIKRFASMEEALARAQSQSSWIFSALSQNTAQNP